MSKLLRFSSAGFLFVCSLLHSNAEQVVISEIMYHPPAGKYEFVEITNLTATTFDIAKWKLRDEANFDFPDFSAGNPDESFLKAFERIVICETDPATFRAAYGLPTAIRVYGPWTGSLSNGGERVTVKDKNNTTRCSVRYNDKDRWPVAADGAGHSLLLVDDTRAIDDYRLWKASPILGGTPGSPEPASAEESYANPEVDLSVGIPYINYGDTWDFNDQNINLGTAWKDTNYNYSHAGWTLEGAAGNDGGLYGFESSSLPAPGINTPTLNSSDAANHITYYFRKTFTYNGPTSGVSLSIDLINDDGAGFWLNGAWIGGIGTTSGAGHTTTASRTVGNATEELGVVSTSSPGLVNGVNVIAVAGKQTNSGSSDFVFGARVSISAPTTPSVVINEVLPGGAGVGFVEFYNPTGASINLGGWHLSDDPNNLTKFQIPGVLNIGASALASVGFTESSLVVSNPTTVYLTEPDGTTVANAINTAMPLDGRSLGRKPTGSGSWFLFSSSTRDQPNSSAGSLGNFVSINEVHLDSNGDIDWVEAYNSGGSAVSASGLFLASQPDLSDKVALSGSIPAGGYLSWNVAIPTSGNEVQLFISDSGDAVVSASAIPIGDTRDHSAAYPDGSQTWYVSVSGSRDSTNNPDRNEDIVINEMMVEPMGGHRDGEFIELYNRGASPVDMTSWEIEEGISFVFPAGTTIQPGGYLVIAANPAMTSAAFPTANVLGPYEGNLSNSGEYFRVVDEVDNVVDEVHYHTSGDWPELASGQGSSLELRHPDMDNSKPSAWADSDESGKSTWQTFTFTDQYLQLRTSGGTSDYKELHLHGVGDCHIALRNVEFTRSGSGNLLPGGGETVSHNGNGSGGWLCQGTHHASDTFGSEFHVISTGHGDVKANRCEIDVTAMNDNDNLTFTTEARWISGKPTLVVNTWDRSCGGIFHLPVPANLGSAGSANTSLLSNPVPTVSELKHSPPVPTPSDAVIVTARVESAVAITSVNVHHRPDSGSNQTGAFSTTVMNDSGTNGDELAGDGIYSATLTQYQSDNQIVQFYVQANSSGGNSITPGLAPEKPAMWVVDNSGIANDLRTQRFVVSQYHMTALGGSGENSSYDYDFPRLSNQYFNATFISDEQDIIYNCEIRKSGSPWTRSSNSDLSRAKWKTPGDKRFRGYSKRSIDNDAGGGRSYHNRIIRHWLYLFGHAANENEFVRVIINGGSPSLREDVEPNANDFLKRNWEDGELGELYRIDDEWWFTDSWSRSNRNADWSWKNTHEPERYHAEWIKRSRETEYDYSSLTTWMEKVGGNSITEEEANRMADIPMMAANAVVRGWCDDWDTLTRRRGKNGYFLRRYSDGKWMLIQWDSDLTFGSSSAPFFEHNLTEGFFQKTYVRKWLNYYLGKMVNDYAATGPRLQAWFDCEEAASGSYGTNENTYTNWHNSRASRAQSDIGSAYNTAFNVTTGNGSSTSTSGNTITLNGTSGWEVYEVEVVGHPEAELDFTTTTAWSLAGIYLKQGSNPLTVQALDEDGNLVASEVFTVTKTGNAPPILAIDADPGSWNVELTETLDLDATGSFDPEGTALSFTWSATPALGTAITGATSPIAATDFSMPGIYDLQLDGVDGDSVAAVMNREAAVFAASGWSSFGDPILENFWTLEDVEVRDGHTPSASYTLDDRPGKLVLKIEEDAAHPLTMSNPSHPIIWRPLPTDTDWALQTDVELDTLQQGDFMAGAIIELEESGNTVRYAFGMENGDFLRVKRSTGGSYSQVFTTNWDEDTATIRIRRVGNQLQFDRMVEPGEWTRLYTRNIPAGSTATSGGIFAGTDTARSARFEFDYVMLIDPNLSNDFLAGLRITEILYNGPTGSDVEFIELTNTGVVAIDLAGVSFDAGKPFDAMVLPSHILEPGESVIITNDSIGFDTLYGTGPFILAQWPGGRLSNSGENITMRDADGNVIHDFNYSDVSPWPTSADGGGFSLQIVDTEGDYNDGGNWRNSENSAGTPGVFEFGLAWHNYSRNFADGHVNLQWISHPQRTYTVQWSTDLVNWNNLTTMPASGTGITSFTDTTAVSPRKMYRIQIAN